MSTTIAISFRLVIVAGLLLTALATWVWAATHKGDLKTDLGIEAEACGISVPKSELEDLLGAVASAADTLYAEFILSAEVPVLVSLVQRHRGRVCRRAAAFERLVARVDSQTTLIRDRLSAAGREIRGHGPAFADPASFHDWRQRLNPYIYGGSGVPSAALLLEFPATVQDGIVSVPAVRARSLSRWGTCDGRIFRSDRIDAHLSAAFSTFEIRKSSRGIKYVDAHCRDIPQATLNSYARSYFRDAGAIIARNLRVAVQRHIDSTCERKVKDPDTLSKLLRRHRPPATPDSTLVHYYDDAAEYLQLRIAAVAHHQGGICGRANLNALPRLVAESIDQARPGDLVVDSAMLAQALVDAQTEVDYLVGALRQNLLAGPAAREVQSRADQRRAAEGR